MLAAFLLLVCASLSASAGVATGFIYPVGDPNTAPGYGNAYHVAQNFNTSYIYGGSSTSPDGGWCGDTNLALDSRYTSKADCEAKPGYKWVYGHTGVDLSNTACGGEIHATADGIVEFSGGTVGYGYLLKIKHVLPNGRNVYSLYGHRKTVMLTAGQSVTKGQIVGYVGQTSNAAGFPGFPCHLHFAIFDQDMPLNGLVAPVGYLYDDKGYITSAGNVVSPNTFRYFYDPLLFVSDRNVEQQTFFPGSGWWGLSFSTSQSVTSRTMYLTNGTSTKSLQDGVTAGWVSSQLQHLTSSNTWEYLPVVPMDSYTFLAANTYSMYSSGSDTYVHWFLPGNNFQDARWRGDMAEYAKVNIVLGFGRGMRETYGNNPNWDPNYGLAMMGYEFNGPSTYATIQVAYLKSDPLTRFVGYLNNQTGAWSGWVPVH